jgi:hypothetical protein
MLQVRLHTLKKTEKQRFDDMETNEYNAIEQLMTTPKTLF